MSSIMSGSSSLMWGDVGGSYLTMVLFLPNDPAEHSPLLPNDPPLATIRHGEAHGREPEDPTTMRPLLGKSENNIGPELFRL